MYRRPMWCNGCNNITDHSVSKLTEKHQNGKQSIKISKICASCKEEKKSWITPKSWVALVQKSYWSG